jgi:hypothetical protein
VKAKGGQFVRRGILAEVPRARSLDQEPTEERLQMLLRPGHVLPAVKERAELVAPVLVLAKRVAFQDSSQARVRRA